MKFLTIIVAICIASSQVVALANAKDLFLFFDKDNSKSVDLAELNAPTMEILAQINSSNKTLSFTELNSLVAQIESRIALENFKTFDYNNDNKISQDEMEDLNYRMAANEKYGVSDAFWYRLIYVDVRLFSQYSDVQSQFIAYDHNGDGQIDFPESFNDELTDQRLVFLNIDADKSGSISYEELFSLRTDKLEELDSDGDGLLSFREFNTLKSQQKSRQKIGRKLRRQRR